MPAFFGYGSLVNTRTHDFTGTKATLTGWRRTWCPTQHRTAAFLSVLPCEETTLWGLTAPVPDGDWEALDEREAHYDRVDVSPQFEETTVVYSVPEPNIDRALPRTIWLSYLDVVLQGYLHQYGEAGPTHFMDTTDGWEIGVTNDRATPQYSRAQSLTARETEMVNDLTARYWR